jgi:hypothetical protein
MAKRRISKPMDTQPASAGWRNSATPMGSQPSKRSKKILSPSMAPAKAESARQSSLKKQRDQIEAIRKRRNQRSAGDQRNRGVGLSNKTVSSGEPGPR